MWGPARRGGAFAPYKRFGPVAQNLGAGGIDFRRALKSPTDTKKKDTLFSVSFFLVDLNGIEPSPSRMRTERSPS